MEILKIWPGEKKGLFSFTLTNRLDVPVRAIVVELAYLGEGDVELFRSRHALQGMLQPGETFRFDRLEGALLADINAKGKKWTQGRIEIKDFERVEEEEEE